MYYNVLFQCSKSFYDGNMNVCVHPLLSASFIDILLQYFQEISYTKVFKNGPSKICGRQPLKNLK